MDREKAIQVLKRCEAESHCNHYKQHYCCIGCGQREALDLAIEALKESQTTHDQMDACYMAQKSALEKLQLTEETSTISENESVEGIAESATTTDCISRADTIKAMCAKCEFVFYCSGDCNKVAVVKGMPPVNQKQITSKLETAEIATSEGEESTMNQPKSKLESETHEIHTETHGVCSDCISKHDLWRIIEDNAYWVTYNETSKEKGMTLTGINQALNECPLVTPTERTGEWIPCTKGGLLLTELGRRERQKWYGYKCSKCNFIYKGNALTESPFCSNCGAKMNKGGDTE